MNISLLTLRKNPNRLVEALARGETVALTRRGKVILRLAAIGETDEVPTTAEQLMAHPGFGMWKDREDMKDPAAYVRKLRRGRHRDL